MERRFLVESKSFVLSILDGASMLRVEEKRKGFFGEVLLSNQYIAWLALTMEVLLGFLGDKEFVKSFREGTKVLIVRNGGNKDGRVSEAVAYGMGGQKRILLMPEGHGGRGLHNFFGELRKAKDFIFATVGCGSGTLFSVEKKGGKEEGPRMGMVLNRTGPSFTEVVRLDFGPDATVMPIVGGFPCTQRWCGRSHFVIPVCGLRWQSRVLLISFRR
jgi:hypothetical protein